jgi:hypothetical protein
MAIGEPSPEASLALQAFARLLEGWTPARPWEPGRWGEDYDEALDQRLRELAGTDWWADPEGVRLGTAGALALGRAAAPLAWLDQAALGGAMALDGWVRYARHASRAALPLPNGLGWCALPDAGDPVPFLDDWGIYRFPSEACSVEARASPEESQRRWRAWAAGTVAYLAGLAERAFRQALTHVFARRQFDRPLAAQPLIQHYLGEAAGVLEGLQALAWAAPDLPDWTPALVYAGTAAVWITALAHQLMGALGFAVETGLHRAYRRAKAMQVWNRRALAILHGLPAGSFVEPGEGLFPFG